MNRKEIAQQTLTIQQQGCYRFNGTNVDIAQAQQAAEQNSRLITPEQGQSLMNTLLPPPSGPLACCEVINQSAVQAILELHAAGVQPAILNFASAKNPGGGFLNGAMAQEEALAASSGLYSTLLLHNTYYNVNRACPSMMYTHHAIYSPNVVFFRNEQFELLATPVTASVLTLPAVNMGQVLMKGENVETAKAVMKERMRLCLAIFANQEQRCLILGAYGCGVFRNNPCDVATWWHELLEQEGYGRLFQKIVFAVFDRSKSQSNLAAFQAAFKNSISRNQP